MFRIILALALLPATFLTNAQNEAHSKLLERLEEYNIPNDFLEHSIRNADGKYSFKFKMTTGSPDGSPIVSDVDYDPRRKPKERWKLVSVDGRAPTKKEAREFSKMNNARDDEGYAQVDKESIELIADNDDYFSFSYMYVPGSIDPKHKHLEDCIGYVYIRKKTGNIEAVRFENVRDTKVRMFKCTELAAEYELQYMEETHMYVLKGEEINIKVNVLGNEVGIGDNGEYYDYQPVK